MMFELYEKFVHIYLSSQLQRKELNWDLSLCFTLLIYNVQLLSFTTATCTNRNLTSTPNPPLAEHRFISEISILRCLGFVVTEANVIQISIITGTQACRADNQRNRIAPLCQKQGYPKTETCEFPKQRYLVQQRARTVVALKLVQPLQHQNECFCTWEVRADRQNEPLSEGCCYTHTAGSQIRSDLKKPWTDFLLNLQLAPSTIRRQQ